LTSASIGQFQQLILLILGFIVVDASGFGNIKPVYS
jgi:hypothetical protein